MEKIIILILKKLKNKIISTKNNIITYIEKLAFKIFYFFGYWFLKKHYYLPIPEKEDLVFLKESQLIGVDTNDNTSLEIIRTIFDKYKNEFNAFPVKDQKEKGQYYLNNGCYMAIDGNAYYSFIRHLKPSKVVEIGSGFSTILASHAIKKNIEQSGDRSELICIEPYPRDSLLENDNITLIKEKVQTVGLDIFESLVSNDILFVDSTHVLKSGGDVWYEYCEILPRLNSGVYVHIHDISLPKAYPEVYYENHYFWNEQYLLQAFLTNNSKFEIVWAGNYMISKYPDIVTNAFKPEYDFMREEFPFSEPSSFWMRVK